MLASLIELVGVSLLVLAVVRLPSEMRGVGSALLLGLPILGATLAWTLAKGSATYTADRELFAFAGALAGAIVGAVVVYLLRTARSSRS